MRCNCPADVSTDGYLLHPALLDACLQVTAGALPPQQATAWLPVKVQRYRVSDAGTDAKNLIVEVTAGTGVGGEERSLAVDIVATTTDGRQVLSIEGLQLQRAKLLQIENLVFYDRWVARLRSREHVPVIPDLSIVDVAGYLESRRAAIAADTGLAAHTKILDALETVCGKLIFWTLHENFRPLQRGISFTTPEVTDSLGIRPEHSSFVTAIAQHPVRGWVSPKQRRALDRRRRPEWRASINGHRETDS